MTLSPKSARFIALIVQTLIVIGIAWLIIERLYIWIFDLQMGGTFWGYPDLVLHPNWFTWPVRIIGFVLDSIADWVTIYGLYRIFLYFNESLRESPFSLKAIQAFRAFAMCMLLAALIAPFGETAVIAFMSGISPDQAGIISIEISSYDVWQVFMSLMFFLVAHILVQAQKAQQEAESFL